MPGDFNPHDIERIYQGRFAEGALVELLSTGRDAFQKIFDAVKIARRFICLEFYIYRNDETGLELASLLKQKVREGVKVYILYDHFGSFGTPRSFWQDLKASGVLVGASYGFKITTPLKYAHRDHRKLIIVDGETVFTGGLNIANEYSGFHLRKNRPWRDTGVILKGPVALSILESFRKSWKIWGRGGALPGEHSVSHSFLKGLSGRHAALRFPGSPGIEAGKTIASVQTGPDPLVINPLMAAAYGAPSGPVAADPGTGFTGGGTVPDAMNVSTGPGSYMAGAASEIGAGASENGPLQVMPIFAGSGKGRRRLRRLLYFSMNRARKTIYVSTAYFAPSWRMLEILEAAAHRGVDTRLLLQGATDAPVVRYAAMSCYKRLLESGVRIFHYMGQVLHAKTYVFDGKWSIVGSANLDFQSLRWNDEGNVGILDAGFGNSLGRLFEEDLGRSEEITLTKWKARPFSSKVKEKVFSVFRTRF
ncbi:MAG: phospholipase D-like domain-containing protein [Actinomycetota bacterium]|nr:phospholipase D-like domain-containing protein [Actinomycetota bacterium]